MLDLHGNAVALTAIVRILQLGRLQDTNAELQVMPSGLGGGDLFVDLLSADYMAKYDIELDFGGGKLNFFSKDHCEGRVVYWNTPGVAIMPMPFRNHHINTPVMLNGKSFKAILDTGAPGTTLFAHEAKHVFDTTKESLGSTVSESGPEPCHFEYTFESMSFEGINASIPRVALILDPVGKNDPNNKLVTGTRLKRVNDRDISEASIVIGINILTKLRLFTAFSENKIYMTPATTPVASQE